MARFGFGFGFDIAPGRAGAAAPAAIGFDFTGGVLPPGATLTRASAATYTAADGTIATAAADMPRFEYDAATNMLRGLLVEPGATNPIRHAGDLTDAAWSLYGGAAKLGRSATPAPDGSASAAALAFGSVGGAIDASSAIYQSSSVAPGVTYTASLWVRAAGAASSARLVFYPGSGNTYLSSGDAAVPADRWVRLTVAAVATGAGVYLQLRNNVAGTSGDMLAWGGQIEAGGAASSVVLTGDSAGSRAADILTLDWGALGVPDGGARLRFSYADGASVDVEATIAGGLATAPTHTRPLTAARLV